jgi:hypothetical protein
MTLASCRAAPSASQSGPMDGWTFIATVGGLDSITLTHLHSLLKSHGIDSISEGSVVYGVAVPTDRQEDAIRVIKADLREREYDITLHAGGKETEYSIPKSRWRAATPNAHYTDVITRPDCAPSTDLGALLRSAEVVNDTLAFPYVIRIKSLERQYRSEDQTLHTGHQFEVEFAVSADKEIGGKRIYFQVWDHGKQIESLGSNEWWHGPPTEIARNKQKYDKRKTEESPNQSMEGTK